MASFDTALILAPNDADILDFHAQNMIEMGYYARAHAASKRAVAIDPLVPLYRQTLARTYFFIGDDENGQKGIQTAISMNPDLPLFYNYWRNYYRVGKYEEAYAMIEQALDRGIYPPEGREFLKQLKAANGDKTVLRSMLPVFERFNDVFALRQLGMFDTIMETFVVRWETKTRPNPLIFTEPVPPELFKYPRWKEQVRKEGILELWRKRGFPAHCRPLDGDDFECDNYQRVSP